MNACFYLLQDGVHIGEVWSGNGAAAVSKKTKKRLAIIGARVMLKMIFVDNFVHGDMHPGNVLVRFGSEQNVEETEYQESEENDGKTSFLERLALWTLSKVKKMQDTRFEPLLVLPSPPPLSLKT